MPRCEVLVRLDDRVVSQGDLRSYFDTMDRYDAVGMGHDRTSTSTLVFDSRRLNQPERKKLQRSLGENKILSIRRR